MRRFAIFLGIVSVILYIANAVVYEAVALTFAITEPAQLLGLGSLLGVLSAGFIGILIASSHFYNTVTRIVYTSLAVWMGTFAYFFFASVLLGILIALASLVGYTLPSHAVGAGLFIISILVSVYGLIHARHITVAHYDVKLPNLPATWRGKKAVFVSDLHLGHVHAQAFAHKVTKRINTLTPDIIFIGGDLYDGRSTIDPAALSAPLKSLTAPLGVYFITGNHEEFGDASVFLEAVRKLGMQVLMDEMVEVEGLQLVGVDYHNANTAEGFKKILSSLKLDASRPSILLKHEPSNLPVAEEAGISLQISGHTHLGQQWPFGYLAQLSYKGFAYGLKNHGTMQQLTSSGAGTWGPPQRVGTNSEIVEITFE